jgi:VIT1/CCC1 family predicted Fe2+/Mn2+ transporter
MNNNVDSTRSKRRWALVFVAALLGAALPQVLFALLRTDHGAMASLLIGLGAALTVLATVRRGRR